MTRPGTMDGVDAAAGRCLCAAITIRVTGALRDVVNCHCSRCRRFTGHHMAATAARSSDLVVTDEGGNLRWYRPVPEVDYGFCARCGSSLLWRAAHQSDTVSICAGVLDPPTGLRTTQAWWVSEASDYHVRPELPEFETE